MSNVKSYGLELYAYPETVRTVGGVGALVVDAKGIVYNVTVNHRCESAVTGDGGEVVHAAR